MSGRSSPARRRAALGVGALLMVAIAVAVTGALPRQSRPVRERLAPLDPADWTRGDHPLGRGHVRPSGVEDGGRALALRLDAASLEGAEIVSRRRFGDGTFGARLRLPDAPGSLTGLFLYEPPDLRSEIDVELVNGPEGRAIFTVYHRGRERHLEKRLGFDPTAGFHDYGFARGGDDVRFLVDGEVAHRFGGPFPRAAMRLFVNAWWPRWLAGGEAAPDARVVIDWVEHPAP